MASGLPFDDIRALVRALPPPHEGEAGRVRETFARAGMAADGLGRLPELAEWLARSSGRQPSVSRPQVALFAGTHGIESHGVSVRKIGYAAEMVELCAAGGAAVNQVCLAHDLGLKVFDLALHLPTGDMTVGEALDERACAATMAFGMEAVAGGSDLICIGGIGVGATTVAAALGAALFGGTGQDWANGTAGDAGLRSRRSAAIDAALAFHGRRLDDPLEALRRLGGREFAAIAGAILAARAEKIPVLLDGPAALAAAAVLHRLDSGALAHCLLAHRPPGEAFASLAARIGLDDPLLDLGIEAGEGTAAALAAGLVKAAALVAAGFAASSRSSGRAGA